MYLGILGKFTPIFYAVTGYKHVALVFFYDIFQVIIADVRK